MYIHIDALRETIINLVGELELFEFQSVCRRTLNFFLIIAVFFYNHRRVITTDAKYFCGFIPDSLVNMLY